MHIEVLEVIETAREEIARRKNLINNLEVNKHAKPKKSSFLLYA
ncbi:hypothetical protein [Pelotomaculum propionicicum]|uniref:Uncharacterized protein n=1 Tax=Pelotomaculum propionicicum TaxID=258475 RepID=A0A4Y7RBS3_9FIRM|nr:hypothetical protein [Pelotomaculum propionicicum]TEB06468.1 hypothetical protein Pmgp_03706 [Pelotomaculum propionicicum]